MAEEVEACWSVTDASDNPEICRQQRNASGGGAGGAGGLKLPLHFNGAPPPKIMFSGPPQTIKPRPRSHFEERDRNDLQIVTTKLASENIKTVNLNSQMDNRSKEKVKKYGQTDNGHFNPIVNNCYQVCVTKHEAETANGLFKTVNGFCEAVTELCNTLNEDFKSDDGSSDENDTNGKQNGSETPICNAQDSTDNISDLNNQKNEVDKVKGQSKQLQYKPKYAQDKDANTDAFALPVQDKHSNKNEKNIKKNAENNEMKKNTENNQRICTTKQLNYVSNVTKAIAKEIKEAGDLRQLKPIKLDGVATKNSKNGIKDEVTESSKGVIIAKLRNNKTLGQIETEETPKCFLCGQQAQAQCNWCRSVSFCPQHQRFHRIKSKCFPFRVVEKKGVGRALVATRPIRCFETILVEDSPLCGPAPLSTPVCPTCLAKLRPGCPDCSRCNLPVCGQKCADAAVHKDNECKLIVTNRVKVAITDFNVPNSIYSFILPYRLLRMRNKESEMWDRVARLKDHLEDRRGLGEWNMFQEDVVNFLRRRCFLSKEFADDDIQRAVGIIAVNGISLEPRKFLSGPPGGIFGRAVFPTFALINHSCMGNAKIVVKEEEREVRVEARTNIEEGEEITVQYYSSVLGTHKRRKRLKAEWYFDCNCERCKDPTECGTMVSAVVCEACEEGFLLPSDPLDYYSCWTCPECEFTLEVPDLERKIDHLEEELNFLSAKRNIMAIAKFIKEMSGKVLHPHHYLLLVARRNLAYISRAELIGLLTNADKDQAKIIKEAFKEKSNLSREYLWIPKKLFCDETFNKS